MGFYPAFIDLSTLFRAVFEVEVEGSVGWVFRDQIGVERRGLHCCIVPSPLVRSCEFDTTIRFRWICGWEYWDGGFWWRRVRRKRKVAGIANCVFVCILWEKAIRRVDYTDYSAKQKEEEQRAKTIWSAEFWRLKIYCGLLIHTYFAIGRINLEGYKQIYKKTTLSQGEKSQSNKPGK